MAGGEEERFVGSQPRRESQHALPRILSSPALREIEPLLERLGRPAGPLRHFRQLLPPGEVVRPLCHRGLRNPERILHVAVGQENLVGERVDALVIGPHRGWFAGRGILRVRATDQPGSEPLGE